MNAVLLIVIVLALLSSIGGGVGYYMYTQQPQTTQAVPVTLAAAVPTTTTLSVPITPITTTTLSVPITTTTTTTLTPIPTPLFMNKWNKCLDVTGNSNITGARLQEFTCNGNEGQTWTLNSDGTLKNKWGFVLDYDSKGAYQNVSSGLPTQKWAFDSSNRLVNTASGKCLDTAGNNGNDATNISVWDCNSAEGQNWQFRK